MDDTQIKQTEQLAEQHNPLAGVALNCPPSPVRSQVMATLAARQSLEEPTMTWIMHRLQGQPLWLRAAALTALGVGLVALTLLLPFARGTSHAPAAFAVEGGFVVVCPLPPVPPTAVPSNVGQHMEDVLASWQQRTNAKRLSSGQHALKVKNEIVEDELGANVAQFSLPGAKFAEVTDLADHLNCTDGGRPKVIAIASDKGDALKQVNPLDDPANPYRGQYTDIDRWIYGHAWTYSQLLDWRQRAQIAYGQSGDLYDVQINRSLRYMVAGIDEDGWMQPVELAVGHNPFPLDPVEQTGLTLSQLDMKLRQEALQHQHDFAREASLFVELQRRRVYATPVTDQQFADYWDATPLPDLKLTPKIPEWLADNPPHSAVLVPSGEVVTVGAPGEQWSKVEDPETHTTMTVDSGLYRYSAAGQLLDKNCERRQSRMIDWVKFYWPDAAAKTRDADRKDDWAAFRHNGSYWVKLSPATKLPDGRNDHASRTPVEAYAYDGTPLKLDAPVPPELLTKRFFTGVEIKHIYAAQQKTGIWFGHDSATQSTESPPH